MHMEKKIVKSYLYAKTTEEKEKAEAFLAT